MGRSLHLAGRGDGSCGMTGKDREQRLRDLFRRYGIAPRAGQALAEKMRRRAVREWRQINKQGRPEHISEPEWDARLESVFARYRRLIKAVLSDTNPPADWRPTEADWIHLAVALAIKHHEPGFEFTPPKPDKGAEARWHRDRVLEHYRFEPFTGLEPTRAGPWPEDAEAESEPRSRAGRERATLATSAKLAEKHIDQQIRRGRLSIKSVSAGHLETDYSKRNAPRQRAEEQAARQRAEAWRAHAKAMDVRNAAEDSGDTRAAEVAAQAMGDAIRAAAEVEMAPPADLPPSLREWFDDAEHHDEFERAAARLTWASPARPR